MSCVPFEVAAQMRAERDAARADAAELATAASFALAFLTKSGNGEGWTATQVIDLLETQINRHDAEVAKR